MFKLTATVSGEQLVFVEVPASLIEGDFREPDKADFPVLKYLVHLVNEGPLMGRYSQVKVSYIELEEKTVVVFGPIGGDHNVSLLHGMSLVGLTDEVERIERENRWGFPVGGGQIDDLLTQPRLTGRSLSLGAGIPKELVQPILNEVRRRLEQYRRELLGPDDIDQLTEEVNARWTPDCITDDDLLQYLNQGEQHSRFTIITGHLKQCSYCQDCLQRVRAAFELTT